MKSANKHIVFYKKSQLLFLTLIFPWVVYSQSPIWTKYSVSSSSTQLCSNRVMTIAFDAQGTQWIGTVDGVSKFDGTNWTTYTVSNGLVHNYTQCIAIDAQGNKWFGQYNKGVMKFDGTTWTNYTTANGLVQNFVTSIAIDAQGNKWFGTQKGISKFNGTTWTNYTKANGLIDDNVRSIAIDAQGNKWIGTYNGLSKFDGTTWTNYTTSNGLINNSITSVAIDALGNKWLGTYAGLSKFDGSTWTNYTKDNGLISNDVYKVIIDSQNNKWITTYEGISKFNGTVWTSYTIADGLLDNNVHSMTLDADGNKWFCVNERGIAKFDDTNWTQYESNGLLSNYVNSVSVDAKNNKWIATYKGVSKYDGTSWSRYYLNSINMITNDIEGNIWASGSYFLNKFDGAKWHSYPMVSNDSLNSNGSIAVDAIGNIWIVTDFGGLSKFDGLSWTKHLNQVSYFNSIAIDNRQNKWLGTNGNGVILYNDTTWIKYTTSNGLINDYVYSVEIDSKGNKWFGTANGVSKFDGVAWTNYGSASGLGGNTVYDIAIDAAGNEWFSTDGGISKFDGTNWTKYPLPNGVEYFNSIAIDNQGIKWFTAYNVGVYKFEDGGEGPSNNLKTQIGAVFNDLNENGIKDINEPYITNQIIHIDSCYYTTTLESGFFYTSFTNGNHKIEYKINGSKHATTETSFPITVNSNSVLDTIFIGEVLNNDAYVDLSGSATRPGFNTNYWISYNNYGAEIKSGRIIFTPDSRIKILRTLPVADTLTQNRIVWNFNNLKPFAYHSINIVAEVPRNSTLGDSILCFANIIGSGIDFNLSNNTDKLKQIITGSIDPNDKLVTPEGTGSNKAIQLNTPLTYTIRFQNTGTDTAFNVNIRDTLNTNLDISTLSIIASSHPVNLDLRPQNEAIFHFNNILLPDSNVNESGSNGFIKYSISPKTNLPENAEITNKAYIYFDFNPPVATNMVKNTYVNTNSLAVSKNALSVAAISSQTYFDITSNINWTVSSNQPWLAVNDTAGCSNATITLIAHANPTKGTRTATITVSAIGLPAQIITITQIGASSIMSMTTTKPIGSTFSFSLQANAANTPVKIDFGDGILVNKTIGTSETTISGTLVGSQTAKIYGSGITYLSCYNDQLTALDVSDNSSLTDLICSYNLLTSLDVTRNAALSYLHCGHNQLSALDITKNSALTVLKCYFNQFSTFDISQNLALKTLDCSSNQLTSLDVSKNIGLNFLYVGYNQFTALDVTKNLALTTLSINNNQFTALDVSKNSALSFFDCKNNKLSTIDVSQNSKLDMFFCAYNEFIFSTLPLKQTRWTIYSYAPQNPISIRKNLEKGDEIDLSNHLLMNRDTTIYKWKTIKGSILVEGVDFTITNGKTTFLKGKTDSLYCEMSNITFPDFKSDYAFKTSCTKVKLNTGIEDLITSGVEIYTYQKMLYINLSYNAQVSIFDLSGRLIMSKNIEVGSTTIPLQNTGIYLVKIIGNKEPVTRKVFAD